MMTYRKLLPTEFSLYAEHLLCLDRSDRYARFSGTVSDDTITKHCESLNWTRLILIGAFADNRLVGAAEICTDRALWPGEAELALSINRSHQNSGIGSRLTRRALTVARNRGIGTVHMLCQASNRRVHALGRRFGGVVSIETGGDATIVYKLPRPTQLSLAQEALDDGTGFMSTMWDTVHSTTKLPANDKLAAAA